jgi:hypothetical protein
VRYQQPKDVAGVIDLSATIAGRRCNADLHGEALQVLAAPDKDGQALLAQAMERLHLSASGYHRILRVARTSLISTAAILFVACTLPRRSAIGDLSHEQRWQRRQRSIRTLREEGCEPSCHWLYMRFVRIRLAGPGQKPAPATRYGVAAATD